MPVQQNRHQQRQHHRARHIDAGKGEGVPQGFVELAVTDQVGVVFHPHPCGRGEQVPIHKADANRGGNTPTSTDDIEGFRPVFAP